MIPIPIPIPTPLQICIKYRLLSPALRLLNYGFVDTPGGASIIPIYPGYRDLECCFFEISGDIRLTSPLYLSAEVGLEPIVRVLLAKDAPVEEIGGSLGTALDTACSRGRATIVDLILSNSNGLGEACPKYIGDALYVLLRQFGQTHWGVSQSRILNQLLRSWDGRGHAGLINSGIFYDKTPLHFDATNGYLEGVELSLRRGADTSVTDMSGKTPLHYVVENNHVEVVKLLVQHGSDIEARDKSHQTPFMCAAQPQNSHPSRGISKDVVDWFTEEHPKLVAYDRETTVSRGIFTRGDIDDGIVQAGEISRKRRLEDL